MPPLLHIRQLSAYFADQPQRPVWSGLNLQIKAGEAVCIWGPNGAGRTTLAKAIMGLVATQGAICWGGQPIEHYSVDARARLGLAYVPETRDVFSYLTTLENLQLAQKQGARQRGPCSSAWSLNLRSSAMYRQASQAEFDYPLERVWEDFPALYARKNTLAAVLSGGEQQMLSLARALLTRPQCLVLDEVFEGLASTVVEHTIAILQTALSSGVALLMMEQKEDFARQLGASLLPMAQLVGAELSGAPESTIA